MFDLKQYSVHEAIEYAKYRYNSPLVIGTDENRVHFFVGRTGSQQHYRINDINYKAQSYCHSSRKLEPNENYEFSIKEVDGNYKLHYISERFLERIDLDNVGFSYKIKKDGTKTLSTKRYEFSDTRKLRMDIQRQEYTMYFENHRYTKKINRNGTTEFFMLMPNGVNIREYYNSKGVCTCSLLFFGDGSTVQLNYKHKRVTFWCSTGDSKRNGYLRNPIVLPNLKDASIINLYNEINCFHIDLMLPTNELFQCYQQGLYVLKKSVQYCSETEVGNKSMFRDMLAQIEMKENET